MTTSFSRVVFSSKSDDWATPAAVYAELNKEFSFDDDPCPLGELPEVGKLDGLAREWGLRVFCNPPYSAIPRFIDKAVRSLENGTKIVCFLLPVRTDTVWFHDALLGKAEIRFIRGRLKFGGARTSAPFPSMVAILRSKNENDYSYECQMEGKPCQRWCGAIPCELPL
jgi:site-specific DNA-methyltransferase (adenine-specific)